MIDEKTYVEILDSGLILDHYLVLCNLKNGVSLPKNKRVQGFLNLLTKKGYIQDDNLTEKGLDLVQNCTFTDAFSTKKNSEDFTGWVSDLYTKCQNKLEELTGKKQVTDKIEKKTYSFLPNLIDLAKVLYKVINLYKLKDYEKIEKAILAYIERSYASNNWFPILQYYIMKNGQSQLVTDMENLEDEDTPVTTNGGQKFV